MSKAIRTRFAPSPTGYIHIGNLRTALYAYLFAKRSNGVFVLRIEDTDQERYVPEAVDLIYRTLQMVGLGYQEGPDVGGAYGPYVQSERKDIYQKYIDLLIEKNGAYRCFCTKERLEALREEQSLNHQATKYDGFCKTLSAQDIEQKLAQGLPFVVRQRILADQTVSFTDVVFGPISVSSNELDEGVLMKSTGLPTYNFANVIDDHLMEISHVIRGTEYISSTPKYILLYQAFGWEIPTHVHLPPIMKSATKKFSKREGDASFFDLMDRGFLKEAVVNAIALLGWHPSDDREIYTLSDLEQLFDLESLQKAPAIFDMQKLEWLNKEYFKAMTLEEFETLASPYLDKVQLPATMSRQKVAEVLKERITTLGEIPTSIDFLAELPAYEKELFVHAKSKATLETSARAIEWTLSHLTELPTSLAPDQVREFFARGVAETGLSTSQMLWAVRIALAGKQFTPGGAIEIIALLGFEESRRRLELAQTK
ncbi:glutamate--tRNA ligase [Patescibacteria group bacterium]|nr:glutamate--tRNA ligase [Patescibacteria group bacterium]